MSKENIIVETSINNIPYKVIFEENENYFLEKSLGRLYSDKREIYLNMYYLVDELAIRKTLIHELTHAYEDAFGLTDIRNENTNISEYVATFVELYAEQVLKHCNEAMEIWVRKKWERKSRDRE